MIVSLCFEQRSRKLLLVNKNRCYPQNLWISLWMKCFNADSNRANVTPLLKWLDFKLKVNTYIFQCVTVFLMDKVEIAKGFFIINENKA